MKHRKKILKRIPQSIFTITLIMTVTVAGVTAYGNSTEPSTEKEEIIYAKTDAAGNVQGVYAVNHFQTGNIIDYGNYSEVKPLNTTDEIVQEQDKITIHSDSDNVYYEGISKSKALPWIFQINYTLNGNTISPKELPGKNGDLTIDISIKENKAVDSSFFDHYALQSTVTLNTNYAELISAKGATIATVGENKQLSYIILPGKEQTLTITAKVKNFEMDPITFNGIRMGLDLNLNTEELDEAIAQVENAAAQLDQGASTVSSGAREISDSTKDLANGSEEISMGAGNLTAELEAFTAAVEKSREGLRLLEDNSESISNGSRETLNTLKQIDESLSSLEISATNMEALLSYSKNIDTSLEQLSGNLSDLDKNVTQGVSLSTSKASTTSAMATLQGDIKDINALISTLQSYETVIKAAGQEGAYNSSINTLYSIRSDLYNAIGDLNSTASALNHAENDIAGLHQETTAAKKAAEELSINYKNFDKELTSLAATLTDTITNMNDLAEGIHALYENYSILDTCIREYTAGTSALIEGYNIAAKNLTLLSLGSQQLAYYTEAMAEGSDTLYQYTLQLADGTFTLAQGAAAFHNNTTGMNKAVNEKINTMIDTLTGDTGETSSFISNKNTSVTTLQFVISGESIKLPE